MDHGYLFTAVEMGMGIDIIRDTMRSPACMPDPMVPFSVDASFSAFDILPCLL